MILDAVFIAVGLVLLFVGGDLLVRGAVSLARRLGVSPLFIGLVLVGFGTSAPELFASIEAVRIGAPAIAWGNVVGSNIANTLLILGIAALIAPLPVEKMSLWRDGGFGLLAAGLLLVLALLGMPVWAGILLIVALIAYLVLTYLHDRVRDTSSEEDPATQVDNADNGAQKPLIASLITLGGLAAILLGGNLLVSGARDIANAFGLSDTLIGLTIVAIGTSAPELATSAVAARRGEGGLAFGNVIGSNIYNILAIGGTTAILAPGSLPSVMVQLELPLIVASALLLMIFARTGHRFSRAEGAGLVAAYAGYLTFAVVRGIS